jgi:hypothetical protein
VRYQIFKVVTMTTAAFWGVALFIAGQVIIFVHYKI